MSSELLIIMYSKAPNLSQDNSLKIKLLEIVSTHPGPSFKTFHITLFCLDMVSGGICFWRVGGGLVDDQSTVKAWAWHSANHISKWASLPNGANCQPTSGRVHLLLRALEFIHSWVKLRPQTIAQGFVDNHPSKIPNKFDPI